MSFRARLTLVAAASVTIAVLAVAVGCYLIVQHALMGEVDQSLMAEAATVRIVGGPPAVSTQVLKTAAAGPPTTYVEAIGRRAGLSVPAAHLPQIPPSSRDRAVADGRAPAYFRDGWVDSARVRIYAARVGPGQAVLMVRPLAEVDQALATLRILLVVCVAAGVGLSILLGRLVAQTALGPVQRLTRAVEHVTTTGDLGQRVETPARDELGRLATNFNVMMGELERSLRRQRQLVADASHELRTPLASLRTHLELLARPQSPPPGGRNGPLGDLLSEIEQLTSLVEDIIDLARGEDPSQSEDELQLDELVAAAVQRAGKHWPNVRFVVNSSPCIVAGDRARIDRAVSNLLDNAGKWSPANGTVEVQVVDGVCSIRDRGPGIPAEDLPHVFDRFWRAPGARSRPGSGLGLAIVHQIAASHGGSVSLETPGDGGTLARLRLLALSPNDPPASPSLPIPMSTGAGIGRVP